MHWYIWARGCIILHARPQFPSLSMKLLALSLTKLLFKHLFSQLLDVVLVEALVLVLVEDL